MGWTKRHEVPRGIGEAVISTRDDVSPIAYSILSAHQAKRGAIMCSPILGVMSSLLSIVSTPIGTALSNGGRISFRPLSMVAANLRAMGLFVGLLPCVTFGSLVAGFAKALRLMRNVAAMTFKAGFEMISFGPHVEDYTVSW